jgi:excisionase family DNA binding protein
MNVTENGRTAGPGDSQPSSGGQPPPGTPATSEPYLRIKSRTVTLAGEVTAVGRGPGCDVCLDDPSVSVLHAELIRRGPYIYVADLGLSLNGTYVNGRPVARRLLADGDVICFGLVPCTAGGIPADGTAEATPQAAVPELTRREMDVLTELCRPSLAQDLFATPASPRQIAAHLAVSDAAVKLHLMHLYSKLGIPEGPDRRTRLANKAGSLGLIRPAPSGGHLAAPPTAPSHSGAPPHHTAQAATQPPPPAAQPVTITGQPVPPHQPGSGAPGLLTPGEVADLLRVTSKTITKWAAAGKLTAIRTAGGHHRYRASEIQALLQPPARQVPPSGDPR